MSRIRFAAVAALVVPTLLGATLLLTAACKDGPKPLPRADLSHDQVYMVTLGDVRLADGVPLTLQVSLRWRVENAELFLAQFAAPEQYGELVLKPKAREIALRVANAYPSVEPVFKGARECFAYEVKQALLDGLKEPAIAVKDVTLADILFPQRFTDAMQAAALKERELEAVRQKNAVDVEIARAAEKIAEAEGQVELKKADIEGRVAELNAKTEEKRRASLLGRAETEAQIDERKAKTEASRLKLLATTEAEKQRELVRVRLEEQKGIRDLDVAKERDLAAAALERDKAIAQLCATSPAYASFLVSRELASKVQIAVVPMGADSGFLSSLLPAALGGGKTEGRSAR